MPAEFTVHPKTGKPVCGALKADGTRCLKNPGPGGNGRCAQHGGSARWVVPPLGYEGDLPENLREKFRSAREEGANIESKLQLLEMFLKERLPHLGSKNIEARAGTFEMYLGMLEAALDKDDKRQCKKLITQLKNCLEETKESKAIESEVRQLIREYTAIAHANTTMELQRTQSMSIKEARAFVAALQDILLRKIRDAAILREIKQELVGLLGPRNGGQLSAGESGILEGEIIGFEDKNEEQGNYPVRAE